VTRCHERLPQPLRLRPRLPRYRRRLPAWRHRWPDPIRDDLLVRRGRSAKAGSMDQTGWKQTEQMGLG
ncbi:MAG: hypothetical protein ACKOPT_07770, partial [Cyanobium sp.]